ncbi:hypothetical protein BJX76DRAFT_346867 [Aspergillus varians]
MQSVKSESESSVLSRTPIAAFLGILVCLVAVYIRCNRNTKYGLAPIPSPFSGPETKTNPGTHASGYAPITPLPVFNWATTDPLVFRPFKPKYHLTMGTSNLDPSELIPMDKTYLSRLSLRKELLDEYPDVVRAVNIQEHDPQKNSEIREALCEWYTFVMGVYLPTRYPAMFRLAQASVPEMEKKKMEKNKVGTVMIESLVTGLKVPVDPEELMRSFSESESVSESEPDTNEPKAKKSLLHLLDTLGSWIDEDFLILLPSPSSPPSTTHADPNPDPEPKYHLQAYTTYYPAGFDTRTKLGRPLSEIHAPVPGYKQKLEKSMDRFFARLEVGKLVVRVNWSIMTPGTGLFAAFGGLHAAEASSSRFHSGAPTSIEGTDAAGDGEEKEEKMDVEGFNGEETYLRCERQTLHRLPKSKALVFAFHTYTYPIKDVRDEGLGEELAVAIDGLKAGSVPGIFPYKRGPYWGEAVKTFLRA